MGGCLSAPSVRNGDVPNHTPAHDVPKAAAANEAATSTEPADEAKKKQDLIDAGAAAQAAAYDPKDTSIPLGLRTSFGYPRDFHNHYTLGRELGHGQFGTTYESIQKSTGDKVAVKAIQKKTVRVLQLPLCRQERRGDRRKARVAVIQTRNFTSS